MTQSSKCVSKVSAGKSGSSETGGQASKVMDKPRQVRGTVMDNNPNSTEVVPIMGVGKVTSDQSGVESKKECDLSKVRMEQVSSQGYVMIKGEFGRYWEALHESQLQVEYVNVGSSVSVPSNFGGSEQGGSQIEEQVEFGRGASGDEGGRGSEARTVDPRTQRGPRRVLVKQEDVDVQPQEQQPRMAEQIFKVENKTKYMESLGERYLFETCQRLENQLKSSIRYQAIELGRLRSKAEAKGEVKATLMSMNKRMASMEKMIGWMFMEITGIFRNLGWKVLTGRTRVNSVIRDELEEVMRNIEDASMITVSDDDDDDNDENGNGDFDQAFMGVDGQERQDDEGDPRYDAVSQTGMPGDTVLERVNLAGAPQTGYGTCKEYFAGKKDENVEVFLKRFEKWYKVSRYPQEEMAVRLTMQLKGEAAMTVDALDDQTSEDYGKVKECLCRRFQKGEADKLQARSAIERVEFHKAGSFIEFMMEIKDLMRVAYPAKQGLELENSIFEVAMRRLPVEFSAAMIRKDVVDYDMLMRCGQKEDAVWKEIMTRKPRGQPVYAARDEDDEDEQANLAMARPSGRVGRQGGFDQQNRRIPFQQQQQPRAFGPRRSNSPAQQQPFGQQRFGQRQQYGQQQFGQQQFGQMQGGSIRLCYGCGQPGHMIANCPGRAGSPSQIQFQQPQAIMPPQQQQGVFGQQQGGVIQPGVFGQQGGFGQQQVVMQPQSFVPQQNYSPQQNYGQQQSYGQQGMPIQQQGSRRQRRDFNRQQDSGQRGNNHGRDTRECFNCGKPGHLAFECRSGNRQQQRDRSGRFDSEEQEDRRMERLIKKMSTMGVNPMMQQGIPFMGPNPMMIQGGYPMQMMQPQQQQFQQQPYHQNAAITMLPTPTPSQAGKDSSANKVNMIGRVDKRTADEAVKEKPIEQKGLMSLEQQERMLKNLEFLQAKFYRKDYDEDPDPNLIATLGQQESERLQAIPIEKRLAVIPVKVNGFGLTALYDTGASITLATRSLAKMVGIELKDNEERIQAVSGHVMRLAKKGTAQLKIGNHTREIEISFAEDDELGLKNPYDMIIGMKTLVLFPPIGLDAANRKLKILDNVGREIDLRTKGELLREERDVFAIEEKEIPAQSGMFVAVLIEGKKGRNTETMTVQSVKQEFQFGECLVNVTKNNRSAIWMENSSASPVKVYKRMAVGKAMNVIGKEDELTNYPEITMAVREMVESKGEIDPAYQVDYSKCDATPEQVTKLKALLEKYEDQFSKNGYDLGLARVPPVVIRTTTEIPFKPMIYPIHRGARDDLETQIKRMVEAGCLVESDTPWVSPIVMVKKKSGELRPCIDLRRLNEITVPDHFPLPRLPDTLDRVAGKAYLTGIDLNKGYQQLPMEEESSSKCGIITPWGVYQCVTMPFGLRNAPSAFMRVMTKLTEGLEKICVVYMDDFIIMTEQDDFDQHLRDVEQVLMRLKKFNIKANPRKCEFARRQLTFLGHVVSKDGIQPDDRNVLKIKEFPVPKNRKEVKRFLGMCSFFRRFIRKYAEVASPLTQLTRKDLEWEWKLEHQDSFEKLRDLLASKPILTFPDDSKDYDLFVDASDYALGIALMQVSDAKEGSSDKVISYNHVAFYTRQFSKSERKWPIVQKELISIIEGLRWSRYYTYGKKVIVHTDHRPLIHLIRKKDAHPNLARWLIELQQYGDDTLEIHYIKGEKNTVADALSRLEGLVEGKNDAELEDLIKGPFCLDVDCHEGKEKPIREEEKSCAEMVNSIIVRVEGNKSIQVLQREDPVIVVAKEAIKSGKLDGLDDTTRWYVENCEVDDKEVLVCKKMTANGQVPIIVPEKLRRELFHQFHSHKVGGGHSSLERTLSKMVRFAWKGKYKEIALWHKECHECQIRAPKRHKVPLIMTALDQVFERMGVDCCGPLFKTSKGNLHYVVCIDMLSKWLVLIPVPDVKAITVARAIYEKVIPTFGCPKEMISDNAKTFTADVFEEVMKLLGVKKLRCTPYHSDGNAITERPIRECSDMIAKYLVEAEMSGRELEWDEVLMEIAFCHNVTRHSTIGMSPFFLMFGREPTFPVDIMLEAKKSSRDKPDVKQFRENLIRTIENARRFAVENMAKIMKEVKDQADKRAKESDISVGELVLYKDTRRREGMSEKYKNPWFTIHRVKAIQGQHAWIAPRDKPEDTPRRVHLNQIKRYYCEEERLAAKREVGKLVKGTKAKDAQQKQPKKKQVQEIPAQEERVVERTTLGGKKLRTLVYDDKGKSKALNVI